MRDYREFHHGNLFHFFLALIVVGCASVLFARAATPQEAGDFPNCAGWIPHQCSCTSNSCYRARPGEVEDLGDGTFRITATGEIIKRTEWSQDGRFMLCAFKRAPDAMSWMTGPGQPIKCVFPPLPAS